MEVVWMDKEKEEDRKVNIGIDIGKRNHVARLLDIENGKQTFLGNTIDFSNSHEGLEKLLTEVKSRTDCINLVFGMEGTGHYWTCLYWHLNRKGHKAVLLNPKETKYYRKALKGKQKTDRIDAGIIAKFMTEKDLVLENQKGIDLRLRSFTRARERTVKDMSRSKNRVHRIMDILFPEFFSMFRDNKFTATSVALLKRCPTPKKVLRVGTAEITGVVRKASRGKLGHGFAFKLHRLAMKSFGIPEGTEGYELELEKELEKIGLYERQVEEMEIHIRKFAGKDVELLETIPGFGRIVAACLKAELGNASRFPSKKHLSSYAGFNPSVNQSGEFRGKITPISKEGNSNIRRLLTRVAFTSAEHIPELKRYVARKRAEGKDDKWIRTAVANKLLHYSYVVLTEQRPFVV